MNTNPVQPEDETLEKTAVDPKRFVAICIVLLVGICSLVALVGGFLLLGSNIDRVTRWTENMPTSSAIPLVVLFMGALLLLVLGPLFLTAFLLYRRRVKAESALPPVDIPGGDPVQKSRRKGMAQVAIGLAVWAVGGCLSFGLMPPFFADRGTGFIVGTLACLFVAFPIGAVILGGALARLQALETGQVSRGKGVVTYLCPSCKTPLGGEEYRHAMRYGYAICPKCGRKVTGVDQ
jgi:DNA-directed RNA polymerase subunit RPC12/RpoP